MSQICDRLTVCTGIVGLASAMELKTREQNAQIIILEKEQSLSVHASDRNRSVLNTGINYRSGMLKEPHARAEFGDTLPSHKVGI